ncbi:MAG: transglutaminase domain-containing protein [Bacteroidales bacterium]|nr:transglutaminase domain-containing protein [Bacteroidales bacterium]
MGNNSKFNPNEDGYRNQAVGQKSETPDNTPKQKNPSCLGEAIFFILSMIIAFLLFPLVRSIIPAFNWWHDIDRIIEIALLSVLIEAILKKLNWMAYVLIALPIVFLTIGSFINGGYGFKDVTIDYLVWYHSVKNKTDYSPNIPSKKNISVENVKFIPNNLKTNYRQEIRNAADFNNGIVRDWAVQQTTQTPFYECASQQKSVELMSVIQSFAIFKSINSHWNYVPDPKGQEYFSKASRTIANRDKEKGLFSGDCDDHAIMMAACMEAVGAGARIVLTQNHAYPELKLGDRHNAELAFYWIRKLFPSAQKATLHYHTDREGNYWLNMDHTANHPGGKFLNDDKNIVEFINL